MVERTQFDLGDKVRDVVSGFEGVVLAKLDALYEAPQCRVHPLELKSDGEIRGGVWLEEGRLKKLESKPMPGFQMPTRSENGRN